MAGLMFSSMSVFNEWRLMLTNAGNLVRLE